MAWVFTGARALHNRRARNADWRTSIDWQSRFAVADADALSRRPCCRDRRDFASKCGRECCARRRVQRRSDLKALLTPGRPPTTVRMGSIPRFRACRKPPVGCDSACIGDRLPPMTGLTEFWLSRRVQRTATTKVHQPLDPKIAKDGLGSGTVKRSAAANGGTASDPGRSRIGDRCAQISHARVGINSRREGTTCGDADRSSNHFHEQRCDCSRCNPMFWFGRGQRCHRINISACLFVAATGMTRRRHTSTSRRANRNALSKRRIVK